MKTNIENFTDKFKAIQNFTGLECEVVFKTGDNTTTVFGVIAIKDPKDTNNFFINDTKYSIKSVSTIEILKS